MKTSSEWSFKSWLAKAKGVDLPVSSLLNDIFGDRDFPDTEDKEIMLEYLQKRKVDAATLDSFESVWSIYQSMK